MFDRPLYLVKKLLDQTKTEAYNISHKQQFMILPLIGLKEEHELIKYTNTSKLNQIKMV